MDDPLLRRSRSNEPLPVKELAPQSLPDDKEVHATDLVHQTAQNDQARKANESEPEVPENKTSFSTEIRSSDKPAQTDLVQPNAHSSHKEKSSILRAEQNRQFKSLITGSTEINCVGASLRQKRSVWTKQNPAGFACKDCVLSRMICSIIQDGEQIILEVHPLIRVTQSIRWVTDCPEEKIEKLDIYPSNSHVGAAG